MRRSLLGLMTVVAIASMLVVAGCQRSGSLNVVQINGGNTLRVDLSDFFRYFDPVDSELITLFQVNSDSVKVELQYLEIGAGLPTYTPYTARISKASVTFKSKLAVDEPPPYQKVDVGLNQTVVADPTGKLRTTFFMTPIPAVWKQTVFGEMINEDDPYFFDLVDLADATITFNGYDSVAGGDVSAKGTFQVEFGNFYDDPNRFGK